MKQFKVFLVIIAILSFYLTAWSAALTLIGTNAKGYREFQNKKDNSILIEIPAGEFWMGSVPKEGDDDEHPQHLVYLDTFYIGKYEVTNEQFDRFIKATGYKTDVEKLGKGRIYEPENQGNWVEKAGVSWRYYYNKDTKKYPVVLISWNDAKAYCDWAGLRLPTEAEWEKAARGTDKRKYPWGIEPPGEKGVARANYADSQTGYDWSDPSVDDGYKFTAPVGGYELGVSPYGGYDMAGNVWEWCLDRYGEFYYMVKAVENPPGPTTGSSRVLRGGSWFSSAIELRCANRNKIGQGYENPDLGFRPACSTAK
jgi:serine/threonine-protein kinase